MHPRHTTIAMKEEVKEELIELTNKATDCKVSLEHAKDRWTTSHKDLEAQKQNTLQQIQHSQTYATQLIKRVHEGMRHQLQDIILAEKDKFDVKLEQTQSVIHETDQDIERLASIIEADDTKTLLDKQFVSNLNRTLTENIDRRMTTMACVDVIPKLQIRVECNTDETRLKQMFQLISSHDDITEQQNPQILSEQTANLNYNGVQRELVLSTNDSETLNEGRNAINDVGTISSRDTYNDKEQEGHYQDVKPKQNTNKIRKKKQDKVLPENVSIHLETGSLSSYIGKNVQAQELKTYSEKIHRMAFVSGEIWTINEDHSIEAFSLKNKTTKRFRVFKGNEKTGIKNYSVHHVAQTNGGRILAIAWDVVYDKYADWKQKEEFVVDICKNGEINNIEPIPGKFDYVTSKDDSLYLLTSKLNKTDVQRVDIYNFSEEKRKWEHIKCIPLEQDPPCQILKAHEKFFCVTRTACKDRKGNPFMKKYINSTHESTNIGTVIMGDDKQKDESYLKYAEFADIDNDGNVLIANKGYNKLVILDQQNKWCKLNITTYMYPADALFGPDGYIYVLNGVGKDSRVARKLVRLTVKI